jgi:hypothetical protein
VETATSLDAIRNGVPDMYGISIQGLLIAFMITAISSMLSFMAVKMLLKYSDKIRMSKVSICHNMA